MTKNSKKAPPAQWQMEDSERLKALYHEKRTELDLTQDKIANELGEGVTQGAVSHFMNGRTALSLEAAVVFAKMLRVPVSAFSPTLANKIESMSMGLPGSGPDASKEPADSSANFRSFDLESDSSYTGVNQHTARAAAGAGADNSHVEIRGVLAFKSDWLRANRLNPKGLDVIYAEGDSMDPTINSGDVLLVDRSKFEPRDGLIFALQSESKGTIVKRLVKSEIDGWIIRSDNPRYRDETLRDGEINEVRIIGRVVWRGGML